ncbi:ragulator complex protein LAMTOR5-like [Ciona intestinalis]|uniref:Ragulator complex protein LAMTOR5 n=1 Tax=Ciona intestinalis TaxID=7719 RepID=H2XKP2_CIOIN
METTLQEKIKEVMQQPNVSGVVCADMSGLCLGHKGDGSEKLAGPIAAMCEEANKLPTSQELPVIVVEAYGSNTEAKTLLIKQSDKVCTGIIKDV